MMREFIQQMAEASPKEAKVRKARHTQGITGWCHSNIKLTQSSSVRLVDGQPSLAATDVARRARAARRYMVSVWYRYNNKYM